MNLGTRSVIINMSAITSSGTGSPRLPAMRSAAAPAAVTVAGVDDDRRCECTDAARHAPHTRSAFKPGDAHALEHGRSQRYRLAAKRLGGAKGIGRTVAARNDAARARVGHGGDEPLELGPVDQLLVRVALQAQLRDP